jgi:hypothetical protein
MRSRLRSVVFTVSLLLLFVLDFVASEAWRTESAIDRRSQALCQAQNITDTQTRECMIRLTMPGNRRDEAIASSRIIRSQ